MSLYLLILLQVFFITVLIYHFLCFLNKSYKQRSQGQKSAILTVLHMDLNTSAYLCCTLGKFDTFTQKSTNFDCFFFIGLNKACREHNTQSNLTFLIFYLINSVASHSRAGGQCFLRIESSDSKK